MKIREWFYQDAGMAACWRSRVRALGKDEAAPEGAETVPEETPVSDWKPGARPGFHGPHGMEGGE